MGFPEQDVLFLANIPLPGKCVILSAPRKNKWNVASGFGISGGTTTWTGVEVAKVRIRLEMWLESQWEAWKVIAPMIFTPGPKTGQVALGVQHPVLNEEPWKIMAVQVESIEAAQQDEEGGWNVEIDLIEFKKPLPAVGAPKAAIPSAASPPPVAQDAADVQIQALIGQIGGLAK